MPVLDILSPQILRRKRKDPENKLPGSTEALSAHSLWEPRVPRSVSSWNIFPLILRHDMDKENKMFELRERERPLLVPR